MGLPTLERVFRGSGPALGKGPSPIRPWKGCRSRHGRDWGLDHHNAHLATAGPLGAPAPASRPAPVLRSAPARLRVWPPQMTTSMDHCSCWHNGCQHLIVGSPQRPPCHNYRQPDSSYYRILISASRIYGALSRALTHTFKPPPCHSRPSRRAGLGFAAGPGPEERAGPVGVRAGPMRPGTATRGRPLPGRR